MRRFFIFLLVGVSVSLLNQAAANAQQRIQGKGPAYTEIPADDPNFTLMGEYIGDIATGESETLTLGLQIRAIGSDEFDAVTFFGGLPGQEKHESAPSRLIGRRSGDFVVLSGGPWAVFVEQERCLVVDRKGTTLGTLERIERTSPTLWAQPPQGATVLFDGTNIDQFTKAEMTEEGLLMQGADIKPMFQDFNLHVEFKLPYMPEARGQDRANSGVYLQSRYECQILDSFTQDLLINGAGALYQFRAPDVNACLPPLVWQTYDIQFTAPRWASDGTKIRNARVTSWLNGIKVQDNVELPNKTGAGQAEEPVLLPSKLQNHGDPVRFRNVWVVDRGLMLGEFPVVPTPEEIAAAKESMEVEAKRRADEKAAQEAAAKAAEEAAAKAEAEAQESAEVKNEQTPVTEPNLPADSGEKQSEGSAAESSGE